MRLVTLLLLVLLAGPSLAQDSAPPISRQEAIDDLITLIEDPVARDLLLQQLRAVPPEAAVAADGSAVPPSPDVAQDAATETGLVDMMVAWGNRIVAGLPNTTFGMPIEAKAAQAGAQLSSRIQSGLSDGQLLAFAAWAAPGLVVALVGGILLRRLGRSMVRPQVPVRKRWVALGLVVQVVAHIGLLIAMMLAAGLIGPGAFAAEIFVTLVVGILLATISANVVLAALSFLAGWRGVRVVAYCQVRFYPWLLSASMIATFAALGAEPTLRRTIGWAAADMASLLLNLVAAIVVTVFVTRHRLAIGRLIFGSAARTPVTDNPLANGMRRLAHHWHVLAYMFLALSIVSLIGGERDNDVLSQMLWSFGVALMAFVAVAILHRIFGIRPQRYHYRVDPVRQVLGNAVMRMLRLVGDALVAFGVIIALGWIWGFDLWLWLTTDGRPLTGPLLAAATVVAVAWLVWVMLDAWIARALSPHDGLGWSQRRSSRAQTLLPLVRNGVMIVVVVLTGIAVLANIGVDVTPLIAGAGVFGLALSFGSQQLVQDVITGIFILAEDTIAIGDTINTGDRSGVVESISLRTIRLRDGDGALHSIPFSTVKALKNSSRNFGILQPRLTVPTGVDPQKVMEAMQDTAAELKASPRYASLIKGDMRELGIDQINAGNVVVSGSLRTSPSRQAELTRAFNGALLKRLSDQGLEI